MAATEFCPEDATHLLDKILGLDDARAVNCWGSPQNMARNVLMNNTTLQFLFHPNVFCDPKGEAARIFDLIYVVASAQNKRETFKQTFPIYVLENRNIGRVHPPLPEIPDILDQFWDAAMEHYRDVYKIQKRPEKNGRGLRDMVKLVMAAEKEKKKEAQAAEARTAKEAEERENSSKPIRWLDKGHGVDGISRRARSWNSFVNKIHGGIRRMNKTETLGPSVDGSDSTRPTRVNSLTLSSLSTRTIRGHSFGSSIAAFDTSRLKSLILPPPAMQTKPFVVETSLADLDGASEPGTQFETEEEHHTEGDATPITLTIESWWSLSILKNDIQAQSESTQSTPAHSEMLKHIPFHIMPLKIQRLPIRSRHDSAASNVPHRGLVRKYRFAKDGSLEGFVSTEELSSETS